MTNCHICNSKDMHCILYFIIHPDNKCVNIIGVGNHLINNRCLVRFCAVIDTQFGRFLGIFYNYAYVTEQQDTIYSCLQIQDASNLFCDTATQLGCNSQIDSEDG